MRKLSLNPVRIEDNKIVNVWITITQKIFFCLLIHFSWKTNYLYCCLTCCSLKITYSSTITRRTHNMINSSSTSSRQGCHVILLTKGNLEENPFNLFYYYIIEM